MGQCLSGGEGHAVAMASAICRDDAGAAAALVRGNPMLFEAAMDETLLGRKGVAGVLGGPLHLATQQSALRVLNELLSFATAGDREDATLVSRACGAVNRGRLGDGATPLMLACEAGDLEVVSMLLQAGADPSARDHPYRKTCLHYAAAKGHVAVITAVVNHSLRVGSSRHTPMIPRASAGSKAGSPAKPARSNSQHRALVDLGSSGGLTALMCAAAFNKAAAVRELLQLGADHTLTCWDHNTDPFCTACRGATALHIAASNGALQAAATLLECYAKTATSHSAFARLALPLSSSPPSSPPSSSSSFPLPPDPRTALDGLGRTPLACQSEPDQKAMRALLNPKTPVHLAVSQVLAMLGPQCLACDCDDALVQVTSSRLNGMPSPTGSAGGGNGAIGLITNASLRSSMLSLGRMSTVYESADGEDTSGDVTSGEREGLGQQDTRPSTGRSPAGSPKGSPDSSAKVRGNQAQSQRPLASANSSSRSPALSSNGARTNFGTSASTAARANTFSLRIGTQSLPTQLQPSGSGHIDALLNAGGAPSPSGSAGAGKRPLVTSISAAGSYRDKRPPTLHESGAAEEEELPEAAHQLHDNLLAALARRDAGEGGDSGGANDLQIIEQTCEQLKGLVSQQQMANILTSCRLHRLKHGVSAAPQGVAAAEAGAPEPASVLARIQ